MVGLGIDISNYSGIIQESDAIAAKNSMNLKHVIIAAQFPQYFIPQHEVFTATGYEVDFYIYLYNTDDYAVQVRDTLKRIAGRKFGRLYLDIEDPNRIDANIHNEIVAACDEADGSDYGVYSARWYFDLIGDIYIANRCPLWMANYDGNPNNFQANFGGWSNAVVKQYAADVYIPGIPQVNLDSWNE